MILKIAFLVTPIRFDQTQNREIHRPIIWPSYW